jgi:hypothetical protein
VAADRRERAGDALRAIDAWGTARGWRGSDPYDGLAATRLAGPLRRSALGMRVLMQAVKRSPVNLRPLLGIPPGLSAAALAHVASAYATGGFLGDDALERERLDEVLGKLLARRVERFDEPCWSYEWDVQTRVFFYPGTDPNTIATAFAGFALLDAWERTGADDALELASGVADFFLRHVPRTKARGGAYFGYLVGDTTPIHNANALVCALLARVGAAADRPDCGEAAASGVGHLLAHQRDDGSWPYGERPHLGWVDNFHTGYVLESLIACRAAGLGVDVEAALDRGLEHYRRDLFLADGTPKYTPGSTFPIDAQCVAQAIQTFARAGMLDDAWRVWGFADRRMRRRDGLFVFQRRRLWANRAPHVRWVEAPMMLALARLLEADAA